MWWGDESYDHLSALRNFNTLFQDKGYDGGWRYKGEKTWSCFENFSFSNWNNRLPDVHSGPRHWDLARDYKINHAV